MLPQTTSPPPSGPVPSHLDVSFPWMQPRLPRLPLVSSSSVCVPSLTCSPHPSAHLSRAQGVVCWVGGRWRVGSGCRRPPTDQLGSFTRFQRALRGQMASQLLEEGWTTGVRDYQRLVGGIGQSSNDSRSYRSPTRSPVLYGIPCLLFLFLLPVLHQADVHPGFSAP